VLWWHRIPVNKPWSIKLLLADGRGFYPDFIVGIRARKTENGGLLTDTKWAYDTNRKLPKILAANAANGRVLILSKNTSQKWAIARVDEQTGRASLGAPFRLLDAAGYA
jgi:hypothetical protein